MKASEMTNEELASKIATEDARDTVLFGYTKGREAFDAICAEAAARLRKADADVAFANACADETGDDCDAALVASEAEVADLRRRLKVAEDALESIYKCVDNRYGVDASLLAKNIIADALAAIRKEGGAK